MRGAERTPIRGVPRPGRIRRPRAATPRQEQGRAEILGTAAEFIAQQGFHGMSMRALAAATGRALASLYNYFDSKEDLLYALQSGAFRALLESGRHAIATTADADARLYAFIANHVSYVTEHRDVMRVLVHEAAALRPEQRRELRSLKDAYFAQARELMDALYDAPLGERERATYSLFGMINWVFAWYEPARHGTPFDVARTIHRMTLCGLCKGGTAGAEVDAVERALRAAPNPSPIRPEVEKTP